MTRYRSHKSVSISVALAAFGVASLAFPALAATQIAGDAKSVSIRLENASIDEALKSLSSSFDLRYRAPTSLTKSISGTYRGPLKDVVKNLLAGYDFVLTTRGTTIEVSVLGKSSKSADVIVERKSPVSKAPVAVQQPPAAVQATAPAASVQAMASDNSRVAMPAPVTADADVPRPILMAQSDPSKMPMPMPAQGDGPIPMPTPAGTDAPMPIPDTSGTGPMPMPQPNADGPMPTLIPPAADAQPPMPQGGIAPVAPPKPN